MPGGTMSTGLSMARAKSALASAGLDPDVPLERASSVTNEVWLSPHHAIRVSRRLDQRLRREAQLAALLPPEVGYPHVVHYGQRSGFDFLVAERRPGQCLSRAWPSMSVADRHVAVRQLAWMLRALHGVRTPARLGEPPVIPQLVAVENGRGSCTAPILDALQRARALPHVGDDLIATLTAFVRSATSTLEPYDTRTLVHGDLTFENVLWDGRQITALIDFEYARGAPRDVDLDVLLRFCAFPFLHVAADYEATTKAADYDDVPFWLREEYPALFEEPHALDRLRVLSIGFELHQLLQMPPTAPARELSRDHPLRRLTRLVEHRSHLDRWANPHLHL